MGAIPYRQYAFRFGGGYLLPIQDGRPAGDPIFLRYGPCRSGSINADGAFVCQATLPGGTYAAWLGSLDSGGNPGAWKRLNLGGNNNSTVYPKSFARWSPDSTQIAYATPVEAAGNTWAVRVRTIATGREREVLIGAAAAAQRFAFGRRNTRISSVQNSIRRIPRRSLLSIDSGRVERLGSFTQTSSWNPYFVSDDDRAIYMGQEPGNELIRLDLSTRQVTTLAGGPGPPLFRTLTGWLPMGTKRLSRSGRRQAAIGSP